MIGQLPKKLEVNGNYYDIRSDYRIALLIFQALNDKELNDNAKIYLMLDALYEDFESIPKEDISIALDKAKWFLDGGKELQTSNKQKVYDWEQDEQMIFSSVNAVSGFETRAVEFLHWWTFLGYFNEIRDGLFTSVLSIRKKRLKGERLEKYEQDFYNQNKDIIDLKYKMSEEEQKEYDELLNLVKGGAT